MTERPSVEAYGYCPNCKTTRGYQRERSPNGRTWCKCGLISYSREWLKEAP